jgi:hypothetical protein
MDTLLLSDVWVYEIFPRVNMLAIYACACTCRGMRALVARECTHAPADLPLLRALVWLRPGALAHAFFDTFSLPLLDWLGVQSLYNDPCLCYGWNECPGEQALLTWCRDPVNTDADVIRALSALDITSNTMPLCKFGRCVNGLLRVGTFNAHYGGHEYVGFVLLTGRVAALRSFVPNARILREQTFLALAVASGNPAMVAAFAQRYNFKQSIIAPYDILPIAVQTNDVMCSLVCENRLHTLGNIAYVPTPGTNDVLQHVIRKGSVDAVDRLLRFRCWPQGLTRSELYDFLFALGNPREESPCRVHRANYVYIMRWLHAQNSLICAQFTALRNSGQCLVVYENGNEREWQLLAFLEHLRRFVLVSAWLCMKTAMNGSGNCWRF